MLVSYEDLWNQDQMKEEQIRTLIFHIYLGKYSLWNGRWNLSCDLNYFPLPLLFLTNVQC